MLYNKIRNLKNLQTLVFLLIIVNAILSFLLLNSLFFFYTYSLPLYFVGFVLFSFLLFLFIKRCWKSLRIKNKRTFQEIEKKLYGKRRLILDSVEDFYKNGKYLEAVERLSREIENNPSFQAYTESENKAFRQKTFVNFFLFAFLICVSIFIYQFSFRKAKGILEYFTNPVQLNIPDYYIKGKPWKLDFSNILKGHENVELFFDDSFLEDKAGIFVIPESYTSRDSLEIEIRTKNFGLYRTLLRKTVYSLAGLFPEKTVLSIIYPDDTGLKREEFAVLQDVEVWKGARIKIDSIMTREIKEVKLLPDSSFQVYFQRKNLECVLVPETTKAYKLSVTSVEGDLFSFPEFTVKVNPNNAPRLRLLFPMKDVVLSYYPWKVASLLEAEDDQGIQAIEMKILVTNRSGVLPIKPIIQSKTYSIPKIRFVKHTVELNNDFIDLFPGETATVEFFARDVFGKKSEMVHFNVISPDFLEMQKEQELERKKIMEIVEKISNLYEGAIQDAFKEDFSKAGQEATELKDSLQKLKNELIEVEGKKLFHQDQIQELSQTMESMKNITEKLSQNAEAIKKITEVLNENPSDAKKWELKNLEGKNLIQEMKSLLKNLEYYQKQIDLLSQNELLKTIYEALKKKTNKEDFKKLLDRYRQELKKMGEMGDEKISGITEDLLKESVNLSMGKEDSFKKSDQLMAALEGEVKKNIFASAQDRMKKKISQLKTVLEEIFMDVLFLNQVKEIPLGTEVNPDITNVNTIVEKVNSVNQSIKWMENEMIKILEGISFYDTKEQGKENNKMPELINNNFKNLNTIINQTQIFLRDYQLDAIKIGLFNLENELSVLFYYLLKLEVAFKNSAERMNQGQENREMFTLGLGDLMKMQAMMSLSLQQLFQQMQKEGTLTSEMKENMENLARLQSEILKNFQKLLGQNQEGAFSGGSQMAKDMEDIIKDLRNYSVKEETIIKSKKLEEKMLQSQKSLQSKGISDKRQAETAKAYEVKPPETIIPEKVEKVELDKIQNYKISEYYRRLIEKYNRQER